MRRTNPFSPRFDLDELTLIISPARGARVEVTFAVGR